MSEKLRIAYIGNFSSEWTTENDIRKAFEYLGHEVVCLQENQINIPRVHGEAMKSDLLLITSTWDHVLPLTEMIDILFKCAKSGIPTATYHLDTFWNTGRGGRKWWLNPMFQTAYIFTADGDQQQRWQRFGKNHVWLPPAVRYDACHFGKFREEYACDVAFVGSNGKGYHEDVWPYRKELVDNLRSICTKNNWVFKNPGGDDPKIDRGEDMNDFYASAKVTVGDSLCLKLDQSKYWSDRVPECLGRGGHLIMPFIGELAKLYDHKLPMYAWNDWDDLEFQIDSQLKSRDYKGNIDARKYCFELTKNNHTYVNRVQTILDEVGL